jgi:hypothetical protein
MSSNSLHYQTVKPILRSCLEKIMKIEEFKPFRLVGGISLSLRYGHCMSDDIDLFTDAKYGLKGLTNFGLADNDPDPICLQNKIWKLIKLDFSE